MAIFDPVIFDPAIFDAEAAPTGVAASSFGWSTETAGAENISGISASEFRWSSAAEGIEDSPGIAASEFGWSTTAIGSASDIIGDAASTFGQVPSVFDGGIFDGGIFDIQLGARSWTTTGGGIGDAVNVIGSSHVVFGSSGFDDGFDDGFDQAQSWTTTSEGFTPEAGVGVANSVFGWSTESAGDVGDAPSEGVADSVFGWTTEAAGEQVTITDQSHVEFDWSTTSTGVVGGLAPIRAKNRRLRPLMLDRGVWYQPGSNPEGRLQ